MTWSTEARRGALVATGLSLVADANAGGEKTGLGGSAKKKLPLLRCGLAFREPLVCFYILFVVC